MTPVQGPLPHPFYGLIMCAPAPPSSEPLKPNNIIASTVLATAPRSSSIPRIPILQCEPGLHIGRLRFRSTFLRARSLIPLTFSRSRLLSKKRRVSFPSQFSSPGTSPTGAVSKDAAPANDGPSTISQPCGMRSTFRKISAAVTAMRTTAPARLELRRPDSSSQREKG